MTQRGMKARKAGPDQSRKDFKCSRGSRDANFSARYILTGGETCSQCEMTLNLVKCLIFFRFELFI